MHLVLHSTVHYFILLLGVNEIMKKKEIIDVTRNNESKGTYSDRNIVEVTSQGMQVSACFYFLLFFYFFFHFFFLLLFYSYFGFSDRAGRNTFSCGLLLG
jgi:ABC-type multidrug transport system permease subunit